MQSCRPAALIATAHTLAALACMLAVPRTVATVRWANESSALFASRGTCLAAHFRAATVQQLQARAHRDLAALVETVQEGLEEAGVLCGLLLHLDAEEDNLAFPVRSADA